MSEPGAGRRMPETGDVGHANRAEISTQSPPYDGLNRPTRLPPMSSHELDSYLDAAFNPGSSFIIPPHLMPPRVHLPADANEHPIPPPGVDVVLGQMAYPMSAMVQTGWLFDAIAGLVSKGEDHAQAPCPTGIPRFAWELIKRMPREELEMIANSHTGSMAD
ncbi:hypothetical protein NMY22_g11908 [Coprinellus aureogranulatus]|nr:hypothetical protein NMY22_g11908 [Coprinellus aureogranulatus]